jgi:hypothetical protein
MAMGSQGIWLGTTAGDRSGPAAHPGVTIGALPRRRT